MIIRFRCNKINNLVNIYVNGITRFYKATLLPEKAQIKMQLVSVPLCIQRANFAEKYNLLGRKTTDFHLDIHVVKD